MGRHVKDLTGQRFGKLQVVARDGHDRHAHVLWLCRCDCGGSASFTCFRLRTQKVTHCGCKTGRPVRSPVAAPHIPAVLDRFLYKHKPPMNFVFCSGDANALDIGADDRRYLEAAT